MTNNELIFENTILAADIPTIKIIPVAISINAGLRSALDLAVAKATPASIRLGAPDIETICTVAPKGSTEVCGPLPSGPIKKLKKDRIRTTNIIPRARDPKETQVSNFVIHASMINTIINDIIN